MKFVKVPIKENLFYWTLFDYGILPYSELEEKDIESLPTPFFLFDLHPDSKIGFVSNRADSVTNIITLTESFESLKIDSDLRKDLKRIEKKNADTTIIENEENALEKSKKWFQELWHEPEDELERRIELWKEKAYTLSAYNGNELLGVHIAMKDKDTAYYMGCWWNREHKSKSIPTFLLKKDIENAIKNKLKYYDLGIGDEPYKKQWNGTERFTKYLAILTKEQAKEMNVTEFIEIK
ncbi:MAG: GNAT family N-acetyltransferase [Candidatus Diapherotrites archaeon]|nr:GNAT family N-acetyltransferase [Candidatus Diapherotrites archaeon]